MRTSLSARKLNFVMQVTAHVPHRAEIPDKAVVAAGERFIIQCMFVDTYLELFA